MTKPIKESGFRAYTVRFCDFRNTTDNRLYLSHDLNAHNQAQYEIVPAVLPVIEDRHKELLTSLSKGDQIEIQFGYDINAAQVVLKEVKKLE